MSKWTITMDNPNGTKEKVQLDMPKEFDEDVEKSKDLWCTCNATNSPNVHAKYVENHMGVNHGWICPVCGKFVQIG